MTLLEIAVTLVVVGILLWLVNSYVPMEAKIRKILNAVVIVGVCIWLLHAFGLLSKLGNVHF